MYMVWKFHFLYKQLYFSEFFIENKIFDKLCIETDTKEDD